MRSGSGLAAALLVAAQGELAAQVDHAAAYALCAQIIADVFDVRLNAAVRWRKNSELQNLHLNGHAASAASCMKERG